MSIFSKIFGGDGPRPPVGPRPPWMPYIEAPQGEAPVALQSLEVRAVVSGLFAETTQTMRFYNPNRRDLEGSLVFPLPDGAVVSGYALDVQGRLVDGVVVPKQEARRILEAEIRKGVDPGLVEQVAGNVYRTRIYPIPAGGARTVRITYVSELNVEGNAAGYLLPLAHAAEVEVDLRVEVVQSPVEPVISGGIGNLTLARWDDRWVAEAKLPKGTAAEDLQVRLPNLPDRFTSIERTAEGAFFCASARLPERVQTAAWSPSRIAVAWDASGSRDDVGRDLALLRGLLKRWDRVTVDLVVFRDQPAAAETFEVEGGVGADLMARLEGLAADGGTDLTRLDLSTAPHQDCESWLLFTDGMGTIHKGVPTFGGLRVDCVSSQAEWHGGLLGHIASQTGGCVVNLQATKTPAAVAQIAEHQSALRVTVAEACEALHTHASHGRLVVLGRLIEPIASVELVDASGAVSRLEIAADDHTPEGRILARAWAGQEVRALGVDEKGNKDAMIELGRRYGLVTPGASLLVLETLEQYLEYDLEPPATWAEMHAQWHARRDEGRRAKSEREEKQIETVLELWNKRVAWWESDFRAGWGAIEREKRAKKGASRGATPPGAIMGDHVGAERPPPMQAAPMAASADDFVGAAMPPESAPEAQFGAEEARPRAKKAAKPASAQASMRIQPWSPDTPYLSAMKGAEDSYQAYLAARAEYCRSPAFYLDCGDSLLGADRREEGLRVLSNLLEIGIDDAALMRMYAWRLGQAGELDAAVEILERVLADRDDEPQSHRDLALMLGERWQRDQNPEDAHRAMELLYEVILRQWSRFPEIELIALMELNRLIHLAGQHDITPPERVDPRLIRFLDLDVRISMSWDADLTDVDLHVFEPTGEHAYYGHNRTAIGGLVSRDFTQGYGPEEYVLHDAYPGTYTVKAHYYGSHQQDLCGACTVLLKVFTNYGRPDEAKQLLTLRLDKPSDMVLVGEITIGGEGKTDVPYTPRWRTQFSALEIGMSIDAVTQAVGQPSSVSGGDPIVMTYHPTQGVEVVVKAAPTLLSVSAKVDGAVLELV